jgi:hypothetical protein
VRSRQVAVVSRRAIAFASPPVSGMDRSSVLLAVAATVGVGLTGRRQDCAFGSPARHVGVEIRIGEADRGETARRGGLSGGHHCGRHGPDLDADAAR